MKKFRPAIGILMIILAIGSMFYWESYGRERFFTEEALYAKHEIKKGELINAGMLKAGRISHENLVQGAVGMNEIKDVVGKIAEFNIPENCQLSKSMFSKRDFFIGKGRAIFVIPQERIMIMPVLRPSLHFMSVGYDISFAVYVCMRSFFSFPLYSRQYFKIKITDSTYISGLIFFPLPVRRL